MSSTSAIDRVSSVLASMQGVTLRYDPPANQESAGDFLPAEGLELQPQLLQYLKAQYGRGLYRHQFKALESIRAGNNTVVATRTSSGKSLIFTLPVLDALLESESATALFLYPQKALANDQLQGIRQAVASISALHERQERHPRMVSRYDGATLQEERQLVCASVQVMLTNPDMLHRGILSWHEKKWSRFFRELRYVIIDECHEYRGIFGTNVAYILRRLRQVCAQHGSNPQFIATSATISEPQAHLERLTGTPFALVGPEEDGSRQGRRKFWLATSTDHHVDFGRKLTLALADAGVRTLAFCPSRVAAERMVARLEGKSEPDRSLRVYRAGLSSAEREEVESGLRKGEIRAVFSTSALELGIDIGALDAVVCIGLPSSMMSLWQRAGRAARAGKEGAIVLIPAESPIDAYFAENPSELFERKTEPLTLSLHNKRVVCQHYACAAKEAGDEEKLDAPLFGEFFEAVRQKRASGGLNLDIFYLEDPHGEVAIRGKGSINYTLVEGQNDLGEIDEFHLLRECPRGAIYRHDGRAYRVKDVIRGKKVVHLGRDFTGNETYPVINKKIRLRRRFAVADHGRVQVEKVAIDVTEFLLQLTEKDRSGKVVKTIPGAGMPQYRLPTEGTRLVLGREIWGELLRRFSLLRSKNALQSIERLFYNLMPTVTGPCDTQDFSSAVDFAETGQAYVYLYDAVYDGVDLSFEAFPRMHDLVVRSAEVVRACPCPGDEGCFRCIAHPRSTEVASKEVTTAILDAIELQLQEPGKVSEMSDNSFSLELAEDDSVPCSACAQPISGGARFCGNCGEKVPALAS